MIRFGDFAAHRGGGGGGAGAARVVDEDVAGAVLDGPFELHAASMPVEATAKAANDEPMENVRLCMRIVRWGWRSADETPCRSM